MIEKREFFRISYQNIIQVEQCDIYKELKISESNQQESYFEFKNVSAGGVMFESSVSYDLGTILKLKIELEGFYNGPKVLQYIDKLQDNVKKTNFFKTIAKVVRIELLENERYEIGCEFVGVMPEHRELLLLYLEDLNK